ncbi:RHS repeat-associated core domain-containing protein [Aliikangiella sp. IMCC44632]
MAKIKLFVFLPLLSLALSALANNESYIEALEDQELIYIQDMNFHRHTKNLAEAREHTCIDHLKAGLHPNSIFDGCSELILTHQTENTSSKGITYADYYLLKYFWHDSQGNYYDGKKRNAVTHFYRKFKYCPKAYPEKIDIDGDGGLDFCAKQKKCDVKTPGAKASRGNPIKCENGEKTETEVIYSGSGPDPLNYISYYSSEDNKWSSNHWEPPIGFNRGDNLTKKIEHAEEGDNFSIYSIVYKNGFNHIFYGKDEGGEQVFRSNYAPAGRLVRRANGTLEQHYPRGKIDYFDSNGNLIEDKSNNGFRRFYTYTSSGKIKTVTNLFNQRLIFNYNDQDLLSELEVPGGQSYFFEYDSLTNLTRVVYPDETPEDLSDNPATVFLYENSNFPHNMTGKINEKGVRFATWIYDTQGRAISSEHADGLEKVEFDFSEANQSRITTFINGQQTQDSIYHYELNKVNKVETKQLVKLEQLPCAGCTAGDWHYEYNDQGLLEQSVDPKGVITRYEYNDRKLEVKRVEAAGTVNERTITTTWNKQTRQPTKITKGNLETTYTYNAQNLVTAINLRDVQSGETRVTRRTYSDQGLLLELDGPRSDVDDTSTFLYDTHGNLTQVTNPLGHITQLGNYDASGRVGTITDPNGSVTELTYTPRGWLKSSATNGAITHYTYFPTGAVKTIELPSGAKTHYEYDDGERLIEIADTIGNRIKYVRDLAGNVTETKIEDTNGALRFSQKSIFNGLSQITQSLGNNGQLNKVTYDANGNVQALENAKNNKTLHSYDALNRLEKSIDPDSFETSFTYNRQDQLTQVTDAEGKTTQYEYNAFGEMTKLISPDTGTSTMTYDAAGNLTSKTDARGIKVDFTYDALNRLLTESYPDSSENITYFYDDTSNGNHGVGRLTRVTDSSGSTNFRYNLFGLVTHEIRVVNGNTYTTAYHYDDIGRINTITYPSGRSLIYGYNAMGQVSKISTEFQGQTQALASDIRFMPFGALQSLTYGNGRTLNQTYDLDYRLSDKSVSGIYQYQYQFDLVNNISAITNSLSTLDNQRFSYDALSRLINAEGNYGVLSYDYDRIGNRLSQTTNGNTNNYHYAPDSHRLMTISGAESREFNYDASGNLLIKNSETTTSSATLNQSVQAEGELVNGDNRQVSAQKGQDLNYYIDLPAGASNLQVRITGGSGDADLYLLEGNQPTASVYDCRPYKWGNNEECVVASPNKNRYYIRLHGYADFADVNLSISFNAADIPDDTNPNLSFTYNAKGRLKTASKEGMSATYQYNFKGERVSKDVNGAVTIFVYDVSGQLIAELDNSGTQVKEYVYLNGQRIATINNNKTYYVHTNHLNTPTALTDENGNVRWKANYTPFGKAVIEVNTIESNLRFPGQYFDAETGLHYNYFRDYDPEIGRYIQSDPIGLNGGINTFGYVGGNPVMRIDPKGLKWIPCPKGMSTDPNCKFWVDDDSKGHDLPNYCPSGDCAAYSKFSNCDCVNQCMKKAKKVSLACLAARKVGAKQVCDVVASIKCNSQCKDKCDNNECETK